MIIPWRRNQVSAVTRHTVAGAGRQPFVVFPIIAPNRVGGNRKMRLLTGVLPKSRSAAFTPLQRPNRNQARSFRIPVQTVRARFPVFCLGQHTREESQIFPFASHACFAFEI